MLGSRTITRRLPLLKLVAIVQLALLARRHLQHLEPHERSRLADLVRHGHRLSAHERGELRELAAKLQPGAFAAAAADALSPIGLPGRRGRRRRGR